MEEDDDDLMDELNELIELAIQSSLLRLRGFEEYNDGNILLISDEQLN